MQEKTVAEKILDRDYDNKIEFKTKKDFTSICGTQIYHEADHKEYNKMYREENNRVREDFKKDALKEVDLSEHPNRHKIFEKAWDDGHANGYTSVLDELEELAELIN